jgi:trimeric autotransporter adhesin
MITPASNQPPPYLGSIVNAASQSQGSISPGEIITIYGPAGPYETAGLTVGASGKVVTSLAGATVLFDGKPGPLIYASPTQLNVMVPYEIASEASTTISLAYGSVASTAWSVPVTPSVPGIFTIAGDGVGPGAVLNQDNSVNSASNPAAQGSVVQIYATGEGQTSPPGVTGSVTQLSAKTPLLTVTATIGGVDALVQYAGSAPDSVAGLLQVNATVPQGIAPGSAVPITVSIGGVPSQSGVTIAVK